MDAFRIASNRDGNSLVLERTARPDYCRAELSCGSMEASTEYYDHDGVQSLAEYFGEIAASWRGWEGDRSWVSLEGELRLAAVHDKLGTITLTAELRSNQYYSPGEGYIWRVRGLLLLDAGALDALARQAALIGV
jgi:hypothetical protein